MALPDGSARSSESEGSEVLGELRLGIDGEALRTPLSGVGRYVYHICAELERLLPRARLFAYSRLPASRLALPSDRWHLRVESKPAMRRLPSFVWLKTRGRELCAQDALDVFWAGRTLHPRLAAVPTVCTVHDLNHLLVPDTMQAPTLWSHRIWFAGDLACAHRVVANSSGTAQRLQSMLHCTAHAVVMPGLDESFRVPSAAQTEAARVELRARGVRPPYLLAVSTMEPRKNLAVLLEAYVELKQSGELTQHTLVLVGNAGWKNQPLTVAMERAARHGVHLTGYVPNELLPALYANADSFIMPSLYEGFGMPVLEARACGTRIVASDTPELREIAGPHAVLVEPNVAGVREGIREALRRPRVFEPQLVEEHSWSHSAAQLTRIFENATGAQGGSNARQFPRSDAIRHHLHA